MPESSFWSNPDPASYSWSAGKDVYKGKYLPNVNKGFDSEKWGKLAGTVSSLFDKARGGSGYNPTDYDSSYGGFRAGSGTGGGASQVLENLGAVFPQQAGPVFIPGVEATGKSTGQRIAGGLGGALSGAAAGAPLGPIGMLAGAALGGFGGAMG